jgi:hypothetical protein
VEEQDRHHTDPAAPTSTWPPRGLSWPAMPSCLRTPALWRTTAAGGTARAGCAHLV